MSARAGVVSLPRGAAYLIVSGLAALVVFVSIVAAFGTNRVVTALLVSPLLFVALALSLFWRDATVLTDDAISIQVPWGRTHLDWNRVVAARFANDSEQKWSVALDLTTGDEPHHELLLLSMPAVTHGVTNAYEMRKREQVLEIVDLLRRKQIPTTVLPSIRAALAEFWKIDLSVG